ncbi:MAG: nucleoside-diphosphate sugar epimerase/dehydratase [Armatimonadota bacterium]|nr:polysaccharide biosynthesis protein [bacterium]
MKNNVIGILANIRARLCVPVLMTADAAALLASIALVHILRFDNMPWEAIYRQYLQPHALSVPVVAILYITISASFRLYRCAWRFASIEMLWGVVWANTVGLFGLIAVQVLMDGYAFPWSVLVMLWSINIVLAGGVRVFLRVLSIAQKSGWGSIVSLGTKDNAKRAVIMGTGMDAVRTLRTLREDPMLNYDVVGFLDDDPRKNGMYISNVQVLGPLDKVKQMVADKCVDEVIVALPEVDRSEVRESIMACRKHKVPVKSVPILRDVLSKASTTQLEEFSVEDLLRRAPVDTSVADIGGYITNSRVLITGAGGSIGSEICRQVASLNPASLILLGHGENSIHSIYHELLRTFPQIADKIHYVIATTANQRRIKQVFRYYRPQVVFHAAAHKHVPMMETNEQEAVLNNVLGTYNVAAASGEHGVERIVLISTDKAADPCCVMGATKWLCEEVFRAAAVVWNSTAFVTVRFGNVLGSRGSVVPLFKEQIRHGGPVKVTHPEMTRFFMTIPEAVRLVLEAGAVGRTGELYLLDMGKPVKILDLARDMIRLCGLEPDIDIGIEFTGVRPGEKLHERLTSSREQIEASPWKGLSIVHRPNNFSPDQILNTVSTLEEAVSFGSDAKVRRLLDELTPSDEKQAQVSSPRDLENVETASRQAM